MGLATVPLYQWWYNYGSSVGKVVAFYVGGPGFKPCLRFNCKRNHIAAFPLYNSPPFPSAIKNPDIRRIVQDKLFSELSSNGFMNSYLGIRRCKFYRSMIKTIICKLPQQSHTHEPCGRHLNRFKWHKFN